MAVDPVTPTTLYLVNSDGVLQSTDGGANWTAINMGLPGSLVSTVTVDPLTPTNVYAGTNGNGAFVLR